MVVVQRWTGALACALQAALRATNESFAHSLGLGVRTVAAWHADPALVPSTGVQQILDMRSSGPQLGTGSGSRGCWPNSTRR